jgi:WD40 repeat protein
MWDLEESTSTDADQDVVEEPDEKFLSPTATVTASKDTHTHSLTSLLYYPIDAGMFLTTAFDRRLLVWDTSTLEPAFCTTFSHAPTSISISPVGHNTLVAVASPGPEVRLVDLASGSSVRSLGTGRTVSVRWSERDGWLLMTGSTDGEVGIWDVRMARGCLGMLGERRGRVTGGHEGKFAVFFLSGCFLLNILNFFGFLRRSMVLGSPSSPGLHQI